jgi:type II secretory pathway pseudopilin PulG
MIVAVTLLGILAATAIAAYRHRTRAIRRARRRMTARRGWIYR